MGDAGVQRQRSVPRQWGVLRQQGVPLHRGVLRHVGRVGAVAAELAFGSVCAGCMSEPGLICAGCRDRLHGSGVNVRPLSADSGSPPVVAAASYTDTVREMILAHKERGRLGLARPLGEALAVAVATLLEERSCDGPERGRTRIAMVPVPSSRRAVRERGHDAVARMSRHAARLLRRGGMDCTFVPALRHRRAVADQSGLSVEERAENLAGALAVRRGAGPVLSGRDVVVVDDIVTTGATLRDARRALDESGHTPFGAAVVAAA